MMFLTGCDENTEWQLPWFVANYKAHTEIPLVIADFGMSEVMREWATLQAQVFDCEPNGWFTKVESMIRMGAMFGPQKFCWIDTDCQVCSDPSGIFFLCTTAKTDDGHRPPLVDKATPTRSMV